MLIDGRKRCGRPLRVVLLCASVVVTTNCGRASDTTAASTAPQVASTPLARASAELTAQGVDASTPKAAQTTSPSSATKAAPDAGVATTAPDAAAEAPVDTSTWATFKARQGFTVKYPKDIFTPKASAKGVRLESNLVVNAPHGMTAPGKDTSHRFHVAIDMEPSALIPVAKRDLTSIAAAVWPGETLESFTPSDLAQLEAIAGQPAYVLPELGAHGYNHRAVYVKLGLTRTLRIYSDIVGEYFWDTPAIAAKHNSLASSQIPIVKAVEQTIEITSP